MTKDIVSKIIYKHYEALGRALQIPMKAGALCMTREEIKELHAITILAYWYLTGEDLQKEPYKEG